MALIILIGIVLIRSTACTTHKSEDSGIAMSRKQLSIEIGERPERYLLRNGLDRASVVDEQPAGINFYATRWVRGSLGEVNVLHGKYSFEVAHVYSMTATEDVERRDAGLFQAQIIAGLGDGSTLPHDSARLACYGFLKRLVALGWKPLLTYSDPRLNGEEAFRYTLNDPLYRLPPTYIPSLEQWMSLGRRAGWSLFAADLVVDITFDRDPQQMKPGHPGAYLLTFDVYGRIQHSRNQFAGADRDRWQTLWQDTMRKLNAQRRATEAKLLQQGYKIDATYIDPFAPLDSPPGP